MRKTLMITVAAASIVGATIATPSRVEARCYGCWAGAGIAAAVIGSALIARNAYGYGGYYGYAPYYGGYAPAHYGYGYAPPVYSHYRPAYYDYAPHYYAPSYFAPSYYGPSYDYYGDRLHNGSGNF